MTKAVLVINMPEHCEDCPFRVLWAKYHCVVNGRFCGDEQGFYSSLTKPSWCPLKSLPEKCDIEKLAYPENDADFMRGWNACLTELMEEENE